MKKALLIIVSVILVALLCVTGVYADNNVYVILPSVTSPPSASVLSSDGLLVFTSSGYSYSAYFGGSLSNTEPVILGIVNEGNSAYLYFGSQQQNATAYYNNVAGTVLTKTCSGYSSLVSGAYWVNSNLNLNSYSDRVMQVNVPTFNSAVDFGQYVASYNPSVSNTYSVVLPYGNALSISSDSDFIITRRAYSVRNTTYNYQKYVRASDDFSYRVNGSYQGIAPVSALSGNFGVAVYGSNNVLDLLIPWQPVNQNIMGRATEYNFYAGLTSEQVSVSSGNAFLIWYPYYANNQDTSKLNEVPLEMSITVTHSSPIYFTTYPITGSTSSSGEDSYISNTASSTDSGSSSQIDYGDGNVTVTFDNAPTAGGNHGQAPINDNNSILGVLSNLQNTLLGLFNKAIDGIHNLITLGSSFLQSVQVMFSWLPAELLVIITSGFVILLTIGVLKTLWR